MAVVFNGENVGIAFPLERQDRLQWKCDNMKTLEKEFYNCKASGIEDIVKGLDTKNVTNMRDMFVGCNNMITAPSLDMQNVTDAYEMFYSCTKLTFMPEFNTSKATSLQLFCGSCTSLITVSGLDALSANNLGLIFNSCKNLTNLTIKNVKVNLTVGSGTSYGHKLTDESLINTAKELWDMTGSTSKTLTASTPSKARFDAIYVKLVTPTAEQIANDPYINNKKPCEVCESTDAGAMTLREYIVSKNWAIA